MCFATRGIGSPRQGCRLSVCRRSFNIPSPRLWPEEQPAVCGAAAGRAAGAERIPAPTRRMGLWNFGILAGAAPQDPKTARTGSLRLPEASAQRQALAGAVPCSAETGSHPNSLGASLPRNRLPFSPAPSSALAQGPHTEREGEGVEPLRLLPAIPSRAQQLLVAD